MKTYNFRGPSCLPRRPWCYCADLVPTRSTSALSRFALILFRKWLRVDFSGELTSGFLSFFFPVYLKVVLGSRGCSWFASLDEFRLCILLVLVRRRRTSFRIFSGTSSLGTFRFLLTFDTRLFLVSNCFRTRRSACRDSGYLTASVNAALRGPTADTVHASTETPSLLASNEVWDQLSFLKSNFRVKSCVSEMLGRFLDSTYCATLYTCSIRRGLCPPTRPSRLEFLQYSRLVFVLLATCTTADCLVVLVVAHIFDGRFNDTTDPFGSGH